MRYLVITIFILSIVGCTAGGSISDEDKNKNFKCIDFRDNSVFIFNTSTITDTRIGFAGAESSYKIVDNNGTNRILKSSMESYMKCEETKG